MPDYLEEKDLERQQLLMEMMRAQELSKLGRPPDDGSLEQLFNKRVNPGPYDPIMPTESFNDTKTRGQSSRDIERRGEEYYAGKLRTVVPEQYGQPGTQNPWRNVPMPRGMGTGPLGEAYNQLPEPGVPRYPMMVMPTEPPAWEEGPVMRNPLDQLLNFYTNESI